MATTCASRCRSQKKSELSFGAFDADDDTYVTSTYAGVVPLTYSQPEQTCAGIRQQHHDHATTQHPLCPLHPVHPLLVHTPCRRRMRMWPSLQQTSITCHLLGAVNSTCILITPSKPNPDPPVPNPTLIPNPTLFPTVTTPNLSLDPRLSHNALTSPLTLICRAVP